MLYLNGNPVPITLFPDRTSQVWKLPEDTFTANFALIKWYFASESEIIHLAQLKDLLDFNKIESCLKIQYLPYGRQDKKISNTSTFALHTFAKILNAMNFKLVSIEDPHSDIALKLINNSIASYPIPTIQSVIRETKTDLICYPDHGALIKYTKEYQDLRMMPYMYGEKVRDQLTGNITNYRIVGDPANKNVLILDDICDGGMTFKILAKDLLAASAKSVVLFVTHGIFSKGLQTLKDSGIQRIYTQDGEASEIQGQIVYRRL